MSEEVKQEQQDAGRDEKKFGETMSKLSAILGKAPSKTDKKKVNKDAISAIVSSLFEEEEKGVVEQVKIELKDLLTKYVVLYKELDAKKKELEKLEKDKKKEFCDAAEKLFSKIDGLPELQKKYEEALNVASAGNKV